MQIFDNFKHTHSHVLDIGRKYSIWTILHRRSPLYVGMQNAWKNNCKNSLGKLHILQILLRTANKLSFLIALARTMFKLFHFPSLWISISMRSQVWPGIFFCCLHMPHRCMWVWVNVPYSWIQLRASCTTAADAFPDIYWMNAWCDVCTEIVHTAFRQRKPFNDATSTAIKHTRFTYAQRHTPYMD